MSTITLHEPIAPSQRGGVVEMAWDPITRIVGSLGIYTKIDFDNQQVVDCHSTPLSVPLHLAGLGIIRQSGLYT